MTLHRNIYGTLHVSRLLNLCYCLACHPPPLCLRALGQEAAGVPSQLYSCCYFDNDCMPPQPPSCYGSTVCSRSKLAIMVLAHA